MIWATLGVGVWALVATAWALVLRQGCVDLLEVVDTANKNTERALSGARSYRRMYQTLRDRSTPRRASVADFWAGRS